MRDVNLVLLAPEISKYLLNETWKINQLVEYITRVYKFVICGEKFAGRPNQIKTKIYVIILPANG